MNSEAKNEMFVNRLAKVFKHRFKIAKKMSIACYRVYDHDLPEFPFCIEFYQQKLYVAEYNRHHKMEEEEHKVWLENSLKTISSCLNVPLEDIFFRQRRKMSHRTSEQQYEKVDEVKEFLKVQEAGLFFWVNLTDYLDTGLFLDHRITRQIVSSLADKKRILNLFCYTGSFSVYAAAGNADSVTSVDLSKTYLKWAEENMQVNDFLDDSRYLFIHADVKQYLKELTPNSFDLVIMDPPTFSNSKRMKDFLDIQRDHVSLINDALRATTTDGVIFFSTNFTKFQMDTNNIQASSIKDITRMTTPFDFEGKLKRACFKIVK